jgi:hypothetical protein
MKAIMVQKASKYYITVFDLEEGFFKTENVSAFPIYRRI